MFNSPDVVIPRVLAKNPTPMGRQSKTRPGAASSLKRVCFATRETFVKGSSALQGDKTMARN